MKHMKVSLKLRVSFLLMLVFSLVVAAAGILGMFRINTADDILYDCNLVGVSQMGGIREELQRQRNLTRDFILHAGELTEIQGIRQSMDASEGEMQRYFAAYEGTVTDAGKDMDYYQAKRIYENEYKSLKQKVYELSHVGGEEAKNLLYAPSATEYINTMVEGFTASMEKNQQWAKERVEANTELFLRMAALEAAVLAVSVLVAMVFARYVSGLLCRPLVTLTGFMKRASATGDTLFSEEEEKSMQSYARVRDEVGQCIGATAAFMARLNQVDGALQSVAEGDLTAELALLSDRDTMGRSLNKMMEHLNHMFGEINAATAQVATGAKQIADGAQALAQGSTEQAASVEELSDTMGEIAGQTKANAQMAARAATLAGSMMESAEKGSRQMDRMMEAVREISEASQSINRVIKVIDDIAFQTNILALNAAVEAARAGQYGKGFAVVAEEVRNLAAKSAEAAKDTGGLIVSSMEKAELGAHIAGETAKSLEEIVLGIRESAGLADEIARSSKEQTADILQINEGIEQVARVVSLNNATAEQSAAASEEMSGQSTVLQDMVARFRRRSRGGSDLPRVSGPGKTPIPSAGRAGSAKY